jgi:succinate dehydrogenase/fumarate reductase flavoprotein subunit
MDVERVVCDVLVIGAGGAGVMAALEAERQGSRVCLVDKSAIGRGGATICASNALAAALGEADPEDSVETHFEDIIRGGHGLNRTDVAGAFARKAPEAVRRLAEYGIPFSKAANGKLQQFAIAGHSRPRGLTAGFPLGVNLMVPLLSYLADKSSVVCQPYTCITKLFRSGDSVNGALGWDFGRGKFIDFVAKAVVVSTGGAMMIYPKTTSSRNLTGDGYIMAADAGASLVDMEFVQFLPTGLVSPRGVGVTRAIAETFRSKTGGVFRNRNGEAFMERYSPDKKDMATWDLLAIGINSEIMAGRGSDKGAVYLDLSAGGEEELRTVHGDLIDHLRDRGVDIVDKPIEVAPMAHYFNGGIRIDGQAGTGVPGLFAAGEVTGGVHGANRLPGDALADAMAFGLIAGSSAAEWARSLSGPKEGHCSVIGEIDAVLSLCKRSGDLRVAEVRRKLRDSMGRNVGVARDETSIEKALGELGSISAAIEQIGISDRSAVFNLELLELLELQKMVRVAKAVTISALFRRESRGCHSRADCPAKQTAWEDRNVIVGNDLQARIEERHEQ